MHKITKGLKKKKKGKKSKHKEEELFKPEELEAYRREHQAAAAVSEESEANTATAPKTTGENEEWKKFIALTAGVDDILKKTQGDLDRIKSTSFFKRIPPPSEVKRQEQEQEEREKPKEPEPVPISEAEAAIVTVSESESEEEEEDDIFDTSYIDALAAAEVKLAYIPDSPTGQAEGDDPFDTSIAERAILGPAVERKGKKLVSIGSAVEVLTGRVQAPTCVVKRPTPKRQILQEQNLLLGSFDDNANAIVTPSEDSTTNKPSLLDEETPLPEASIDLSKNLQQIAATTPTPTQCETGSKEKDIIAEFDVIAATDEDDEDKEFELLASESLSKTPVVLDRLLGSVSPQVLSENWSTLTQRSENSEANLEEADDEIEDDPFDTTFAENILPGKAELKIIESEILNAETDFEFDPRAVDKYAHIINQVSIQVTDPAGQRESVSSLDRVSEAELNLIKPIHRDLLGGSNTDLASLSDQPLKPVDKPDENYIEYCDPFDTSIINSIAPGQTELKFLEKELLGDIKADLSDDEFDPRAFEAKPKERQPSRPDVLDVTTLKTVSFDLPSPEGNVDETKTVKPLTPYYVRKNSIPGEIIEEDSSDPFDTSFVGDAAPGKEELKLIERDLFTADFKRSLSDPDFNPRDEKQVNVAKVVQVIQEIYNPPERKSPVKEKEVIDLLSADNEVHGKVLTPATETHEEQSPVDPFDTSIANNILPGKTELKLLETELITSSKKPSPGEPQVDLFHSTDTVIDKPLSPIADSRVSFDLVEEDVDPFDTSIANNIAPGRAELKLLENELI